MSIIETEEAARRLAIAIASDLSVYFEDRVASGIVNDNLFEVMADEIEKNRELYMRRVTPQLYKKNFYDRAMCDVLVKTKGHLRSKMW